MSFALIDMLAVGVELSSNVHRIRPVPGGWSARAYRSTLGEVIALPQSENSTAFKPSA
jgi:hypothetical protein